MTVPAHPGAYRAGYVSGPFLPFLFLVLLVLKAAGVVSWSWWVITAPLWGPFALVLAFLALVLVGGVVIGLAKKVLP